MITTAVLLYLFLPVCLFWWGWFEWWIALPCTAILGGLLAVALPPFKLSYSRNFLYFKSPQGILFIKSVVVGLILSFGWTYLSGVGGFRPQHFDYFKHNLLINNLIRYSWPVVYHDQTYLAYYHAYYLVPTFLAKWTGGISWASYYFFVWTWLGLFLVFRLLQELGGTRLLLLFLFFNSPEGILWLVEIFKSSASLKASILDLWRNDHTIELIQTPGGLMFPSHVESFIAAPQHSLFSWLGMGLLLKTLLPVGQKTSSNAAFLLACLLLISGLYWSPLATLGLAPFVGFMVVSSNTFSLKTTKRSAFALVSIVLTALPILIFYAGHFPIFTQHGWWWNFLKSSHDYLLLFVFLALEVGIWGLIGFYLFKKNLVSKLDTKLLSLTLVVLTILAFYRYGFFNDLARRACLAPTLVVCWFVAKYLIPRALNGLAWERLFSIGLVCFCVLIPFKQHLRWFTSEPYTTIVDKKISDFTPYTIHYLDRYHSGQFDVVTQYLGRPQSIYMHSFAPSQPTTPKVISKAFYYWKSTFKLSSFEKQALLNHKIDKLYVKFFDVDWDGVSKQAIPKAVISFAESPPVSIVPTVFITNRSLENLTWGGIDELGENIATKISQICHAQRQNFGVDEVQIDCDWSLTTKSKYFKLLLVLKTKLTQSGLSPKPIALSATIRLHQIKFYRTTGVPPIAKGMLMYYNMGNWKTPNAPNSILDLDVAHRYADYISDYPLPLDVVLPIFRWGIVYRNGKFISFINHLTTKELENTVFLKKSQYPHQYVALKNTHTWGIAIRQGDILRIEECHPEDLIISSRLLAEEIQNSEVTFAFYHLDSLNLSFYEKQSLFQVFRAFR